MYSPYREILHDVNAMSRNGVAMTWYFEFAVIVIFIRGGQLCFGIKISLCD